MRTQVLHSDVDERSWHLPEVDPTGWLTRRSAAGGGPGNVDRSNSTANADRPGPVQRRRPRRSEGARAARERELARRRRRRQGRVFVVDTQTSAASVVVAGRSARPVASARRVADPTGRSRQAAAGTYRLGRWGRLAVTLLVAATLALVIGRLAGSMAGAATELVDVTVGPGDTLWSIASSTAPDRDPRAVIDEIRTLNDVPGDVVRVGEVIRVPTSAG